VREPWHVVYKMTEKKLFLPSNTTKSEGMGMAYHLSIADHAQGVRLVELHRRRHSFSIQRAVAACCPPET